MPVLKEFNQRQPKQSGFTLIELVIVMMISGILAVGSTVFIVNTAKGLNDIKRRDAIATSLSTSLQKIESHLSQSLPGSVRVKRNEFSQCLEMLPVKAQSFYRDAPFLTARDEIQTLSLNADVKGLRAIIGSTDNPALYSQLSRANSGLISAVIKHQESTNSSNVSHLSLTNTQVFKNHSPQRIVRFVHSPISYCIEAGNLFRYSDYGIKSKQALSKTLPKGEPSRVLLAQDLLAASNFQLLGNKSIAAIVLSAGNSTESLTLNQQIGLGYD